MKPGWRRVRRIAITLLVLSAVAGAGVGVYRYRMARTALSLPVAPVRQGDFQVMIRCRGQLRAERSVTIYAPIVPQLRIAWLATAGETIQQGQSVVKFDSSTAQQQVLQKEAALKQAQATLDQYLAQARTTSDQDKTDLADAGFNVEKARLQASKTDIVSKIQSEEDKIDLGIAQQKEKAQQATVELHQVADRSKLASLTRLRDQAQSDLDLVKKRIGQMELKAPITGYLTYMMNYSQGWVNAKEFKVGDNVGAGQPFGEIPDLNTLEMDVKVEETDRGKLVSGMKAMVHIDSLPELPLEAKVDSISPLAEQGFEWPPTRSFHAYAALAHPDQRLRPKMNGGLDIVVDRVPNAISIPAKALFTRDGKPVVYLANNGHYRAVEVQVLARNPDEVAISGVASGSTVALADPMVQEKKK